MHEIINESTSKLWILAPVIVIGIIVYAIVAILDKQRIKTIRNDVTNNISRNGINS